MTMYMSSTEIGRLSPLSIKERPPWAAYGGHFAFMRRIHLSKALLRPILGYVLLTLLFSMAALVCGVILGSMIS